MPLVFLLSFPLILERDGSVDMPLTMIMFQLIVLLLVPVCIGMWSRHKWARVVLGWQPRLRKLTSVILVFVIVYSLSMKSEISWPEFLGAFPYAFSFMLCCSGVGWLFGRAFGLDKRDTRALIVEYSFQSAAIPTMIIISILQKMEWMVFVGAVGTTQLLIGLAVVAFEKKFARESELE
jgi:BASS family bile acid:Na+ symporter